MTQEARRAADEIGSHPALTALARVGHVVNGVLHLAIAGIALQVAWGGGGGQADQSGALAALAEQPLGTALLWVFVVGGGDIYRQTIDLASRLELTEIAASPQAEVFFPEVDDAWREVRRTPREGFDWVTYEREPHEFIST